MQTHAYCSNCQEIVSIRHGKLDGPSSCGKFHECCDMVCNRCHSVIATTYSPIDTPASAEFFTIDEVAVMRFMEICQPSLSPERYSDFIRVCEALALVRGNLRDGFFERIEAYLRGERHPGFCNLGIRKQEERQDG